MKVGMVVDNEFYGDPRVYNEAKILTEGGFQVSILCFNFSDHPLSEERAGIKIYRIHLKKKIKNILFANMNTIPFYHYLWARQIKKFIKKIQPETLHIHDLYMARAAHIANKKFHLPIILDLHENYPAAIMSYNWATNVPKKYIVRPKRWRKLEKKYLEYADKRIVLSDDFRDDLIERYPNLKKEDFCIYPNVPDVHELFSYPIDHSILDIQNSFIMFYFGGIAERRGIFTCFEALKILTEQKYDVKLLIIGPIDKIDIQPFNQYMKDPVIQKNIIHYPWKDISTLPSYILKSDVCLSPIVKNEQHESGVANKVFQYLLFERPIIVSDCKPQVSIVEQNHCGLVFKSGDAQDLALQVQYMITNPEKKIEMGKNGKAAVIQKFNVEIYKQNLVNLHSQFRKH